MAKTDKPDPRKAKLSARQIKAQRDEMAERLEEIDEIRRFSDGPGWYWEVCGEAVGGVGDFPEDDG